MTNKMLGLTLVAFALLGLPAVVMAAVKKEKDLTYIWFLLVCTSNILWALSHALFYLLADEKAALFFLNLRLVFVCTTCIFVCLVILTTLKHVNADNKLLYFLFAVPCMTFVFVFADHFFGTGLINTQVVIEYMDGTRVARYVYAIWFWVHCVCCYAMVAMAAKAMISHFRKMPVRYRVPVTILFFGTTVGPAMSIIAIAGLLPYSIDLAPLVSIVAQVLCYFAIARPHDMDILVSSRDIIFEMADHPMLIVSNDSELVDFNRHASEVGRLIGYSSLKGVRYADFLSRWMALYEGHTVDEEQSVFTLHEAQGDAHFQAFTSTLFNRKNKAIGTCVEIKNITPTMAMIHKLQDSAYFDNLTGLRNRNYLSQILLDWDKQEYLPLGIVVGDLNDLKVVNDTYGHAQGDVFLQAIAHVLETCKPPDAVVSRYGGDEFVTLAPNTSREALLSYEAAIETMCRETQAHDGLALSMAKAFVIREDLNTPIADLIHQADKAMYLAKWDRRKIASSHES